jgi:hypothetical protein
MLANSRQTIHMGINFVVNPRPTVNAHSNLRFQQSLVERGIDFAKVEFNERAIVVVREAPVVLNVQVAVINPEVFGQLLIVAPQQGADLALFSKEAEAVVQAFEATWAVESRQTVAVDATFRDLYEASAEHAFMELWEARLGQRADALAVLGHPVLGGGLRLVMRPHPGQSEPFEIEVRIESFLKDTKKIWVETQFRWPQPMPPGVSLDPSRRLKQVDDYIDNELLSFIRGGQNEYRQGPSA